MARAIDCLVKELEKRFLTHGVMDSMGVIYMCKRLSHTHNHGVMDSMGVMYMCKKLSHTHNTSSIRSAAKASFVKHLCVIKRAYCDSKKVSNFDM